MLSDKNLRNTYFQSVSEHKDIIRSSMSLQGLILILRDDVSKVGNVNNNINIISYIHMFIHIHINYYI